MLLRTAAIVLAGGKSTRLGRDKAAEPLLGMPLLQRVLDRIDGLTDECVIVTRPGQDLASIETGEARLVEDIYPGKGPLGGLYTGLSTINASHAVAVACDMPLLAPAFLCELLRLAPLHDAVVPVSDGLPQPLCAAYRKSCLGAIQNRIDAGELKLSDLLDDLEVLYLHPNDWRPFDPDGLSFQNVNREEDLGRTGDLLAAEESLRM